MSSYASYFNSTGGDDTIQELARIYKITNSNTNKVYIGFTTQKYLSTRFNRHFYNARLHNDRYNSKLYNSMQKYSRDVFSIEEIYCSKNIEYTLKVIEPMLIKEFDSYRTGYNTSTGGEGRLNVVVSLETRKKLSVAAMKYNPSIWKLTSINGSEYILQDLKLFCKSKCIPYTTLWINRTMPQYGIAKVEKVA